MEIYENLRDLAIIIAVAEVFGLICLLYTSDAADEL